MELFIVVCVVDYRNIAGKHARTCSKLIFKQLVLSKSVNGMLFYYCFGLFKLAVIVQQIYARYIRGQTDDPRFADLNQRVAILARTALRAITTGNM